MCITRRLRLESRNWAASRFSKVEEAAGKWHFVPAWSYGDIDQGDEAIYSNGIYSSTAPAKTPINSNPDVAE